MEHSDAGAGGSRKPWHYEIRITGELEARWAGWFDGLTIRRDGDGTTVMSGPVVDQAALHGHLQRVRDLGLPLLTVTRTDATPTEGRQP